MARENRTLVARAELRVLRDGSHLILQTGETFQEAEYPEAAVAGWLARGTAALFVPEKPHDNRPPLDVAERTIASLRADLVAARAERDAALAELATLRAAQSGGADGDDDGRNKGGRGKGGRG